MGQSLFRFTLLLSILGIGIIFIGDAAAQQVPSRIITAEKDRDRERYQVDLNNLQSNEVIELLAANDRSFTVVTALTNYVTGRFDADTNINFFDASTNFVGKIEIPKKDRGFIQFNAVPAITNTSPK